MQRRNIGPFVWMYPVSLMLSAALIGWGLYIMAGDKADRALFAAGAACLIICMLVGFAVMSLYAGRQEMLARIEQAMNPVNERLQHLSVLLDLVSEQQLISERAKAIAFRDKDRETLRRAIREEITAKDFDTALKLVAEIETAFGLKQEADQLRSEIMNLRDSGVRREINEAVAAIDRYCRAEQWTLAFREAERIVGVYPEDAQAKQLPADVESRRLQHKQQLLDAWHDAVGRHDVDGSIEILKNLDIYLTPQEAVTMQETARQVFKDKLLLLGHQFTTAVKEHQWREAVRLGEAIVAEYPNSRMATEVNAKLDLLRQRAAELAATNT